MRRTLRLLTVLSLLVSGSVTSLSAADFEHQLDVELQPGTGEIRIKDQLEVVGIEEFRFSLAAWLTHIIAARLSPLLIARRISSSSIFAAGCRRVMRRILAI
jgi:hypothetical protein